MVVQRTIDNLKDKPHDEKKAVASGIAIGVVIILLVGWGFLFLRKIQKGGTPTLTNTAVPQDQFDAQFLQQTQQQLNEMYQTSSQELQDIRDSATQNQIPSTYESVESAPIDAPSDGFGSGGFE